MRLPRHGHFWRCASTKDMELPGVDFVMQVEIGGFSHDRLLRRDALIERLIFRNVGWFPNPEHSFAPPRSFGMTFTTDLH